MADVVLQVVQQGGAVRRRPPYFKTKKLAILGSTASLEFTPWHDPSWTLAAHPCCRPRCKREPDWYFDLHRPECFRTQAKQWNKQYLTWLRHLQTPIFMQENWPDIPMAVRYPLETVLAEYRPYFTNHVSYMVALALMEGVTHIGLYGCQYSSDAERGRQRDSMTYWLGFFEGQGGKVCLPPRHNDVLRSPWLLYGYESHDEQGKLVPEYRVTPTLAVATGNGGHETRALTPVDMHSADGRVPLMPPPNGEPIAWERSGHTVHQ